MKAPLYCRCASAPWGSVAYNKLYPSAVIQSNAGNLVDGLVDQLALGDPSGPFTGGVVADTVKHAFADEALLTDAQLYPGLDESAADLPKPHGPSGHHVHCKGDEGGCEGRQWSVEVEEIFPGHPEDDVDVKVAKVHLLAVVPEFYCSKCLCFGGRWSLVGQGRNLATLLQLGLQNQELAPVMVTRRCMPCLSFAVYASLYANPCHVL